MNRWAVSLTGSVAEPWGLCENATVQHNQPATQNRRAISAWNSNKPSLVIAGKCETIAVQMLVAWTFLTSKDVPRQLGTFHKQTTALDTVKLVQCRSEVNVAMP